MQTENGLGVSPVDASHSTRADSSGTEPSDLSRRHAAPRSRSTATWSYEEETYIAGPSRVSRTRSSPSHIQWTLTAGRARLPGTAATI